MIKYAIFAGTKQEYKNWLLANEVDSSEAKYIRRNDDINGLGNVVIVMVGSYHEKGQWYSNLADRLEAQNGRETEDTGTDIQGVERGGNKESQEVGESDSPDVSGTRANRSENEENNRVEDESGSAERPDLPRRKSDASETEGERSDGFLVEGGIRYWQEGDNWYAAHDATYNPETSKVGFGKTKEAAFEAWKSETKNGS